MTQREGSPSEVRGEDASARPIAVAEHRRYMAVLATHRHDPEGESPLSRAARGGRAGSMVLTGARHQEADRRARGPAEAPVQTEGVVQSSVSGQSSLQDSKHMYYVSCYEKHDA